MKTDLFFLENIKLSVEKILDYTSCMDFDMFMNDSRTIDAVERNFEIIGESVKKLSVELKAKYPNVPFKQIAGMRDKLIHDYFGTDYKIVWATIQNRLPEFRQQVLDMISSFQI